MAKKNIKKRVYNFTAIFEPANEGGYIVYIPALPGCATQGETFEEAENMAKDAIEGYLKTIQNFKKTIPKNLLKISLACPPLEGTMF